MNGFLLLDKALSITSNDAINGVKRFLPRRIKIGHAGSLDPLATGVLVLMIGQATKQCENVMRLPKEYVATIELGATTETDDAEGERQVRAVDRVPTMDDVREVCRQFVGEILQTPPAYSAMKLDGKRAYALVRAGKTVVMRPRPIHIDAIEIVDFAYPNLTIRVSCGRGTYVRSLARDIGERLNTGGFLAGLRRTKVGPFTEDRAYTIDKLRGVDIASLLQPVDVIAG